jgi:hypothetical protein
VPSLAPLADYTFDRRFLSDGHSTNANTQRRTKLSSGKRVISKYGALGSATD